MGNSYCFLFSHFVGLSAGELSGCRNAGQAYENGQVILLV